MVGEQEPGARSNADRSFLRLKPGRQGESAQQQSQSLAPRAHV
jgi:hypothetical protein